jgi:hypothetical protein
MPAASALFGHRVFAFDFLEIIELIGNKKRRFASVNTLA